MYIPFWRATVLKLLHFSANMHDKPSDRVEGFGTWHMSWYDLLREATAFASLGAPDPNPESLFDSAQDWVYWVDGASRGATALASGWYALTYTPEEYPLQPSLFVRLVDSARQEFMHSFADDVSFFVNQNSSY